MEKNTKAKRSTFAILFYLNTSKRRKDGTCPIVGRITVDANSVQFSTKINLSSPDWDAKKGRAKKERKELSDINRTLDRLEKQVKAHYSRIVETEGYVTAERIKNALNGIGEKASHLLQLFQEHNAEFEKRVGVNRELSTQVQYENSLNHLKRFMSLKCKLSDIPFTQLDFSFIEKYDFYLRVELKLKPNTILGIMRHLRKMIKLATGEGIITHDPFDGYSPERPKAEQKYLTRDELQKIITTPLDHPCRYLTRDMFIVLCQPTGIYLLSVLPVCRCPLIFYYC
jgi:integrase/recombinase XerD